MVYHSYWPVKGRSTLKSLLKNKLSIDQIKYIEDLYDQIPELDKIISDPNISKEMRFYYYKEFLSLFNEFNNFEVIRKDFHVIFDENVLNMIKLVDFIRNLIIHYPLFSCWDDVIITREMTLAQSNYNDLNIAEFLKNAQEMKSFFIRLTYQDPADQIEAKILFPKIESFDDVVALNSIITEKDGVICLLAVMNSICKQFMVPMKPSKLNQRLNISSRRIDDFLKNNCLNIEFKHRLGMS